MIKNFNQISIKADATLLYALRYMDEIERKLLIVIDGERFIGLLSIGDIQRAIINNADLNTPIRLILRKEEYVLGRPEDKPEVIKNMMLCYRTEFMPVVNGAGELVDVYFWEDLFGDQKPQIAAKFDLPVVIMAGGIGTRLKPLTNVLPKPLIPINSKTMLEEIFDRFKHHGSRRFYISVNYKADLIKYYINSLKLDYDISYFEEEIPLGTAGSLSLLKGKIHDTFFVSNCDILIDQDYSEMLRFHRKQKNEITVVAALKHFPIAYGTLETGENGQLTSLLEKPDLTLKINTGMYILEPGLIDEIPVNTVYNLTDLITTLQRQQRNVGVFPVWQSSWIDIGDWKEYLNVLGYFKV